MPSPSRKTLTTIATVSALAAGGAAFANAATSTTPSSSSSSSSGATSAQSRPAGDRHGHGGRGGPRDQALTGTTAAKVKAVALDKVPGSTVLRTEKGGPGNAAYHAHVRKSSGTEVVVLVNADFEATSVQTRPAGSPGGPGGHGRGGPRGEQTALTGDTAAKVKAAALDKVPGGTVLRTETGGHDGAAYHAHVRKSDGSEVVVLVNAQFEATAVKEHDRP